MQSPLAKELPEEADTELLRVLSDSRLRSIKFSKVCNLSRRQDGSFIFGEPGSELRRAVQKRRDNLIRPGRLERARSALSVASKPYSSPCTPSSFASPQRPSYPPPCQAPEPIKMSEDDIHSDQKYNIHFNRPWLNPGGIVAIRKDQIPVDGKLVDKLRVMLPIWDIRDFQQGLYSAKLTTNGDGILSTEPCTGESLRERDNVDKITVLVDKDFVNGVMTGTTDELTKTAYEAITTDMADEEYKKVVKLYKFPSGVTCNNDYFNKGKNEAKPSNIYRLKSRLKVDKYQFGTDANGNTVHNFNAFVVWEMAIDSHDDVGRRTRVEEEAIDDTAAAMAALGLSMATGATYDAVAQSPGNEIIIAPSVESSVPPHNMISLPPSPPQLPLLHVAPFHPLIPLDGKKEEEPQSKRARVTAKTLKRKADDDDGDDEE